MARTTNVRQKLLFCDNAGAWTDDRKLVGLASALGAGRIPWLSAAERLLLRKVEQPEAKTVEEIRRQIRARIDPLGDMFCKMRSPEFRRADGAIYTPHRIVASMLSWCEDNGVPEVIVDPGAGSGRFLVAAGKLFRSAELIGIELAGR